MVNGVIRIAQVIGPALNGGTEAFVMNYYKHIDHTKVEFDFFVENESLIVNQKQLALYGKGKIVIIPSYKRPIHYINTLTNLFKEGKYDIVHSNMNSLSFLTLKAAKKANIQIRIAHSHSTSTPGEFLRNFIKKILRLKSHKYPTHYCSCSISAGTWLFGEKALKDGKITVIPNAIYLEKFKYNEEQREKIRKKLQINDTDFVLGTVGRLVTQKNPLFTLEVFKKLIEKKRNSKLIFVGDGPMVNQIQDRANQFGILDKIVFVGSQTQIEDFYFAMDCFIFPSLYEGLGISLVEAQATGLSCVCSDKIPSEAIILSSTISLSLSSPINEWVDSIISSSQKSRSQETQTFVDNKFSIIEEANHLVDFYEGIVNKRL